MMMAKMIRICCHELTWATYLWCLALAGFDFNFYRRFGALVCTVRGFPEKRSTGIVSRVVY